MPKELFNYDAFNAMSKAARDAQIGGITSATNIARETADTNIEMFTQQANAARASLAPFRDAGAKGVEELNNLLGLNGADAQNISTQRVLNSPQVRQMIEQGVKGVESSKAASGTLGTGRALEELFNVGQKAAVSEIARNQNALFQVGQQGLQAAGMIANVEMGLGTSLAGENRFAGETAANGALAAGNVNAQYYNTAGQIDLQKQLDKYSFGAPGGFGGQPDLTGGSSGGSSFNPRNNINPNNGLTNGSTGVFGNTIQYGNGVTGQVAGTYGNQQQPAAFQQQPTAGQFGGSFGGQPAASSGGVGGGASASGASTIQPGATSVFGLL